MTIKPFKTGNTDVDPDKAYARLESWLDNIIPIFLESPEYKKLSKANKKSGGSWFHLFMDLELGYIGKDLKALDIEDVEEILLELFPRKVICPDSKAKTIIPELIAIWEFLHRELNAGKKPQLPFAVDIIGVLKGIKRDYLSIFKGEADSALSLDDEVFEELLMQLQSDESEDDWIDALIIDTTQNLDSINQAPEPPEQWKMLWDMNRLDQFLGHVLVREVSVKNPQTLATIEELLNFGCQELFRRVRQKDQRALSFLKITENNIVEAANSGSLIPESMKAFISVLSQHRQYLSEEFLDFIHEWMMSNDVSEEDVPDDQSFEGMIDGFQHLLNSVPDEFIFISALKSQLGFLPADGLASLVHHLLSLGSKAADALTLLILDQNKTQAIAVAETLNGHTESISPKTLSRLIRIRNWLPAPVQQPTDQLIKNVRKLGIMPQTPESLAKANIQEVYMSSVDGAGTQGVMLLVKEGKSFRLISFVLKENLGVIDVMVSPPETKTELKKYITLAKEQGTVLEKVSLELIQKQLPVFLALNVSSHTAIDHELIQVMELLGLEEWNPASTSVNELYSELIPQSPSVEDIERVQKRSEKWTETNIGWCWFNDSSELKQVIDRSSVKGLYKTICNEVLESDRNLWGERMGRMALWAQYANSKRKQQQSQDFAVASWLLEHSELPAFEVELLRAIAKNSVSF